MPSVCTPRWNSPAYVGMTSTNLAIRPIQRPINFVMANDIEFGDYFSAQWRTLRLFEKQGLLSLESDWLIEIVNANVPCPLLGVCSLI